MYSRLMGFLDDQNLIYVRQFGFRKHHSTTHALINIVERIRKCLDKGELACGVFVDLQKAFDTVDHSILLSKLDHYGIRIQQWNRIQQNFPNTNLSEISHPSLKFASSM